MSLELLGNSKEFEKLLKICRKQGVTEVSFGNVSVKFGELPKKNEIEESDEIPTDEINHDELIYYAVNGAGTQQ